MVVNFREKPEMAFRNTFCDSSIRGDSRTRAHVQRGTVQMMYYEH